MGEFNLGEKEKRELKDLIEGEAQNHLQDELAAKESFKEIGEIAEDKYGVKKALFKKIAKAYFLSDMEEQTEAAIKFKEVYQEALGEVTK